MNRRSREETKSGQGIKIRLTAAAVLLLISAVFMITAAKAPDFAEWYSGTVYPLIVTTAGRLWGILRQGYLHFFTPYAAGLIIREDLFLRKPEL